MQNTLIAQVPAVAGVSVRGTSAVLVPSTTPWAELSLTSSYGPATAADNSKHARVRMNGTSVTDAVKAAARGGFAASGKGSPPRGEPR